MLVEREIITISDLGAIQLCSRNAKHSAWWKTTRRMKWADNVICTYLLLPTKDRLYLAWCLDATNQWVARAASSQIMLVWSYKGATSSRLLTFSAQLHTIQSYSFKDFLSDIKVRDPSLWVKDTIWMIYVRDIVLYLEITRCRWLCICIRM